MKRFVCLEDFEEEAQAKLPESYWKFHNQGAYYSNTAKDNVEAYKRYLILPKVLCDVSEVDISTTILGEKLTFPVGIAPTGLHCLAHPDGELATGKACSRAGTCMIQSLFSTKTIEEVTKVNEGLKWMQIQPIQNYVHMINVVQRAEKNGYKALVVTCDDPGEHRLFVLMRDEFHPPFSLANFPQELSEYLFNNPNKNLILTEFFIKCFAMHTVNKWEWIDWLRSITTLPIVLKGIMRADDAIEALKHDIQAILVSNHGGRTLDGVPATIDVLPEIIEAVNGKVEVYVDGGIRHGNDVFKALALGAKAVFVGRPILWGLACNGEDGAYDVLRLLREELHLAMTFAGCSKVADITPDYVRHASYYTHHK